MEGNYELHSLYPNYKQVTFHKCIVARIKRGLLQSEQESEKNRRARKRLIKAIDDDDFDLATEKDWSKITKMQKQTTKKK